MTYKSLTWFLQTYRMCLCDCKRAQLEIWKFTWQDCLYSSKWDCVSFLPEFSVMASVCRSFSSRKSFRTGETAVAFRWVQFSNLYSESLNPLAVRKVSGACGLVAALTAPLEHRVAVYVSVLSRAAVFTVTSPSPSSGSGNLQ